MTSSSEETQTLSAAIASEPYAADAHRRGTYLLGVGALIAALCAALLYETVSWNGSGVALSPETGLLLAVALLLAVYSVVGGYRTRLPGLSDVVVTRAGIELRWVRGDPTALRWDDPRLGFELSDRRDLRPVGRGEFVSVIKVRGRRAGVTPEIVDAVLAAAERYGATVSARPYAGSWGRIVRYRIGPRPPG